jgi:hypothetical protein
VCSECGLAFWWADVFRPGGYLPAWSFEHAPHCRLRTLLTTAFRAATPWLFWKRLRLDHPVAAGRLLTFAGVMILLSHAIIAALAVWCAEAIRILRARFPGPHPSPRPVFQGLWPYRGRSPAMKGLMFDYWIGWAVAAMVIVPLMLLLLRQTMGRQQIRRQHVLRGAAYSLTPLPILCLVFVGAAAMRLGTGASGMLFRVGGRLGVDPWNPYLARIDRMVRPLLDRPWLAAVVAAVWLVVFWISFSKWYLRLPRPVTTTLVLLGAAWLVAMVVVGMWPGSRLLPVVSTWLMGRGP